MGMMMHTNGSCWLDVQGQPIQTHGGGLLRVDDWWYWYGEDKSNPTHQLQNDHGYTMHRVDVLGVACYRSRDLIAWERVSLALAATPDAPPHHDLHPSHVLERPKVLFHRPTGTFVMWVHLDRADYSLAATGVAIADKPEGPFQLLATIRPGGMDSRDQTLFLDDDGTAYHLCSTDHNETTLLTRLSDDYRSLTTHNRLLFPKRKMEAHALARCQGRYWYLASGCTGWAPNTARTAVADDLWGTWTELENPCQGGEQPDLTWGGQSTYLQTLPDGRMLAMFDVWKKENLSDSGYIWTFAQFKDGRYTLPWLPHWKGL